jgi:hypothetical protein
VSQRGTASSRVTTQETRRPTSSINGSTLTIDPTALLAYSTAYYVEIDATAIDDLAGNSYAGFSGSSTWAFTTTDDPTAGLIGGGTGSGITVTASSL